MSQQKALFETLNIVPGKYFFALAPSDSFLYQSLEVIGIPVFARLPPCLSTRQNNQVPNSSLDPSPNHLIK
jgi:hypothetical protein